MFVKVQRAISSPARLSSHSACKLTQGSFSELACLSSVLVAMKRSEWEHTLSQMSHYQPSYCLQEKLWKTDRLEGFSSRVVRLFLTTHSAEAPGLRGIYPKAKLALKSSHRRNKRASDSCWNIAGKIPPPLEILNGQTCWLPIWHLESDKAFLAIVQLLRLALSQDHTLPL